MTPRATKETLYLRREFTADERLEMGASLAQAHNRLAAIDDEEKSMKATIKERKTGVELTIGSLSRKLNDGYEMENQSCTLHWNVPNVGEVTYHNPLGDAVKVRAMTVAERQDELPFEESAANIDEFFNKLDKEPEPEAQPAAPEDEFFKPGRPAEFPTPESAAPIAEEDAPPVEPALPETFEHEVRQSLGVPEPFPATLKEQLEKAEKVDNSKPKKSGPSNLKEFHSKQTDKKASKPTPPADEVW